jgi:hypothetical protein
MGKILRRLIYVINLNLSRESALRELQRIKLSRSRQLGTRPQGLESHLGEVRLILLAPIGVVATDEPSLGNLAD